MDVLRISSQEKPIHRPDKGMPPPPISQRTRPLHRFAEAAGRCAPEGRVYGQCIMADYNNVYKDKCLTEFMKLKECYLV